MKKLSVLLLTVVLLFSLGISAAAAVPQATDIENYVGNPGMSVSQEANGIHVKVEAEEGGTFTTSWGYSPEQKLDGLTITLENLTMDYINESGLCIAIGNYEGAYYGERALLFVLNSSLDKSTWLYAGRADKEIPIIQMTGSEITDISKGVDVTFQWEKKSEDLWAWKINGKEYRFSNDIVEELIDDEEFVFVSFGGWNPITNIEYTITGIGQEEDIMNQEPVEPETPEEPTDETDDDDKDGLPVGILVLIIVMAVLLVAVTGLLVYFLVIKPKKSV